MILLLFTLTCFAWIPPFFWLLLQCIDKENHHCISSLVYLNESIIVPNVWVSKNWFLIRIILYRIIYFNHAICDHVNTYTEKQSHMHKHQTPSTNLDLYNDTIFAKIYFPRYVPFFLHSSSDFQYLTDRFQVSLFFIFIFILRWKGSLPFFSLSFFLYLPCPENENQTQWNCECVCII